MNKARELVEELLDSGYFTVIDALKFADSIAEIKCKYALSFVDASVIATAEGLGIKALFKMEKELKNKDLKDVIFIENIN
nr:PIN domain-containing protein [Acidianus sp. HS-5]